MIRGKKIGLAFSDFVTEERVKRVRRGRQGISSEVLSVFPLFFLVVIFSILLLRLFYLQVLRGDYYAGLSDQNRIRTKIIPAERGIIKDRYGRVLVRNVPAFKVLENGKVKFIERDEALKLLAEGEEVQSDTVREYLYKDAFSHVLGYVGQIDPESILRPTFKDYSMFDFVGKSGIEKEYEVILHGENGKELSEVEARGDVIRFLGKQEPTQGREVNTSLDLDLQLAAHKALENVEKGAVVVSDPNNGSILVLYSKPNFDSNLFTHSKGYKPVGEYKDLEQVLLDDKNQPLLDRVIGGVYPPGSTYKLITAVAALETGAITKDTKIEDTGVLRVGAFSFGNWYFSSYGKTDGFVDVVMAIKRSNDIFFYKAAEETGVDNIYEWSKKFGLGERLGIDIDGEARGLVPNGDWKKKNVGDSWYLGDTYHLGIGQGFLLTTPLQVNFWTTVFANGGVLYRPHLLAGEKEVLKKDFIKDEYIELVRDGMKQSCESTGVAWPFFEFKVPYFAKASQGKQNSKLKPEIDRPLDEKIDGKDFIVEEATGGAKFVRITVGCKTGTAETQVDQDPHAWITVFAPFYKPEVVVTVLVEYGGEGSSVAGPIARDILKEYFEKKNN
ncbi:MAG: hypothetical protein C4584_00315 [Armatimonadetes bacterium]|nr:MAG: hypothetical protein C4584_00315 [Armatimonadota bacterium]